MLCKLGQGNESLSKYIEIWPGVQSSVEPWQLDVDPDNIIFQVLCKSMAWENYANTCSVGSFSGHPNILI